uniref:Uncharacterized protein n=1 Tax=viral metagenome TaxID=1070528 RepID=A0A6C0ATS4_9ZZZZ
MTNKKKSVKTQKKKTPQKMFPYRKRGDKKGKQNKTSKNSIRGGDTTTVEKPKKSRIDKLYEKDTIPELPDAVMDKIPSGMMDKIPSGMMDKIPSGMMDKIPSGMMDSMLKNVSPDMIQGLSPQESNTDKPDDTYNTALAEQKAKIDVAADTVSKELIDTLCQTTNRAVSSAIHYKILGSTILSKKEINTIGEFFNVDTDKLSDELNADRGIKIGDNVSFPDETMKEIITTLFTKPNSKEILYDSIPRIVNELDLPQIFYNMGELDRSTSKTNNESPDDLQGGDDGEEDEQEQKQEQEQEEEQEEDENTLVELKATPLNIDDELVGTDTSKDDRLISLKSEIHDKVFSNVVELLNKEEDGLTLMERQLTSHMSNEHFVNRVSDILVAKNSYLITELGTEVIYKTLMENEELVPLLKDALQFMATINKMRKKAVDDKNEQKLSFIDELITELKQDNNASMKNYIKFPTKEKNEEEEEEQEEEEEEEQEEEEKKEEENN